MTVPDAFRSLAAQPASAEAAHGGITGYATGVAAAVFLAVTLAASLWNLVRRRWLVPRLRDRDTRRAVALIHRDLFPAMHGMAGGLALVVGIWHGVVAPDHWTLWLAMVTMGLVSIGGLMLQFKWASARTRRRIFLLHSQQVMTVVVVGLLVVGHLIV